MGKNSECGGIYNSETCGVPLERARVIHFLSSGKCAVILNINGLDSDIAHVRGGLSVINTLM